MGKWCIMFVSTIYIREADSKMQENIEEFVLSRGAFKAGWVKVAEVPFDAALRKACEANGCGKYKRNYTCPPYIGDVETLIAQAQEYEDMLLFQTVGQLEDSYDFEGMQEAGAVHNTVTQGIFDDAGPEDCLVLGAGGCDICETCGALTDEPCRDPKRALASLESYGINVSKTAALAGMKYINGENTVTFFSGIFLKKGVR